MSSAYCKSFTYLGVGRIPLMLWFTRTCKARSSAVYMYRGIDRAHPCLSPFSRGIVFVSHLLTLMKLTEE